MGELEYLRNKAIELFKKDKIKKNWSYHRCIENIKNDTNIIRLERVIKFLGKWEKMNPDEKQKEYLKICRECDKRFNTHLEELELKIQKLAREI
jgi:hypothetical protein